MEKKPRISIVTPSFNQAVYLEYTIRSVLDQRCKDLEYIIIDAGSTDGSLEIIKQNAKSLSYWTSEPDAGHADGLNKGFAKSHGEIMAWLNSSDVYYPWTLKTVVKIFDDLPDVQWLMGMPSHLNDGKDPKNIHPIFWNIFDFLSGRYSWIQQESVFWRRSLWEQAGGGLNTDLKYACDFELWLRFFKIAPLYHVQTILGGFRIHKNQRGSSFINLYRSEVLTAFQGFRKSTGRRDRMRGMMVRMTQRPFNGILRLALKQFGLMKWYEHPLIVYDFDSLKWIKNP